MTRVLVGDARERLRELPDESVHCCVTSPPYWGLRAYRGEPGMIGLEPTLNEHIAHLVAVFQEVRRVLRRDGTLWLNYGDAYAGGGRGGYEKGHGAGVGSPWNGWQPVPESMKPKDLMLLPARVALALQADGWWVRSEVVWHKPNPMPESCTDRPTSAHEKLFLLSREARYFYDAAAVARPSNGWCGDFASKAPEREDSRRGGKRNEQNQSTANLRNVWTIPTHSFSAAHFATFPPALVEPCIRAGTSELGVCGSCGAPWVRVVSTPKVPDSLRNRDGAKMDYHPRQTGSGQAMQNWRDANPPRTTGWEPSCECGSDVVPARVLDPFGGAGTVGLVAERLQRDAVLVEISPEYAAMAEKRIRDDAPLLARVEVA